MHDSAEYPSTHFKHVDEFDNIPVDSKLFPLSILTGARFRFNSIATNELIKNNKKNIKLIIMIV
jgi:hypothetical protein